MATALIILADGFEEIEAVAVIDILRRGGVDLTIAGLDKLEITSSRQLCIKTDETLASVLTQTFSVIILPGGEPGTTNLQRSPAVAALIMRHAQAGKIVAAICAAPRILANLGLLSGKRATSFPGTQDKMTDCLYTADKVVCADQFITSRGPATAPAFAFTILEKLGRAEISAKLQVSMQYA